MKYKFKTFALVLLTHLCTLTTFSQVTIGHETAPEKGALLQLKDQVQSTVGGITSEKGGLLLPRVHLNQKDELYPFFTAGAPDYIGQARTDAQANHTGLIVYNLNIDPIAGFEAGIYEWNGAKWLLLQKAKNKAILRGLSCSTIRVNGSYYQGVALGVNNTITLSFDVEEEGTYEILATTNNGFQFQSQGEFASPGSYTVSLNGIGTPTNVGVTSIDLEFNNNVITVCPFQVTVGSTVVSYSIVCGEITANGTYTVNTSLDMSNYVTIPVIVENSGTASFVTNTNNGMYFSVSQAVTPSTTTLTLRGYGVPEKAGNYSYNFTTNGGNPIMCNFNVKIESNIGSFTTPAKNCYEILRTDPTKIDGEYWIQTSGSNNAPVKTYCDMTNGGYTLLWSYSEKRAHDGGGTSLGGRTLYGISGSMLMNNTILLKENGPSNVVTTEAGVIPYRDYRLSLATMENVRNNLPGEYRVRIANAPTDMVDAWGLANYFRVNPRLAAYDYISATLDYTCVQSDIPTDGRLYNIAYNGTANTAMYNGVPTTAGSICPYSASIAGGFGNHWDAGYRIQVGNVTMPDGTIINTTGLPGAYLFNNLFGFFGEEQGNHHFGKCPGDDYSFSTYHCPGTQLVPHSFNSGEGRYLQWWVK